MKNVSITLNASQAAEIAAEACLGPVLVAEYRSFDVKVDKKANERNGTEISKAYAIHVLEISGRQVRIFEGLPDGSDGSAFKSPAARGDMVFVPLVSCDVPFKDSEPLKAKGPICRFGVGPRAPKNIKP